MNCGEWRQSIESCRPSQVSRSEVRRQDRQPGDERPKVGCTRPHPAATLGVHHREAPMLKKALIAVAALVAALVVVISMH